MYKKTSDSNFSTVEKTGGNASHRHEFRIGMHWYYGNAAGEGAYNSTGAYRFSDSQYDGWARDLASMSVTLNTNVMIYSNATENKKAGSAILNAVAPISPGCDYSLRVNSTLAELNSTRAIAVYLEVEFHDTKDGANWIINNVKSIGEAICKGVCKFYAVDYISESTSNTADFSQKLYQVQIGAFSLKSNAENCLQKAKTAGFTDAFIKEVQP